MNKKKIFCLLSWDYQEKLLCKKLCIKAIHEKFSETFSAIYFSLWNEIFSKVRCESFSDAERERERIFDLIKQSEALAYTA